MAKKKSPTTLTTEDCERAATALANYLAGDLAAIDQVIVPIGDDPDRLTGMLIATWQICGVLTPADALSVRVS